MVLPIPDPPFKIANNYWIQAFLGVQDHCMRNKEHITATNHLCQINDLGSPGNTLVGNYCHFLGGVRNGNGTMDNSQIFVSNSSMTFL
jgi:hypothetical protein